MCISFKSLTQTFWVLSIIAFLIKWEASKDKLIKTYQCDEQMPIYQQNCRLKILLTVCLRFFQFQMVVLNLDQLQLLVQQAFSSQRLLKGLISYQLLLLQHDSYLLDLYNFISERNISRSRRSNLMGLQGSTISRFQ